MSIALLNAIGLLITTCAAFLMWRYPPRLAYFTEKGEPHFQWVGDSSPEHVSSGRWQRRFSRLAPVLLTIGFALQLPAAVVAAWPAK